MGLALTLIQEAYLMAQVTTGYVELDDGKLYYEEAGAGTPLVLLHTGFADSRVWDDQWQDFARRYRTIRFDMRGFGKSTPPSGPIARRRDLHRLLDHLGADRAALLGCSLGGEVILDYALENPGRVAALVPVSTAPGGFEFQGPPPATLMEMMAAVKQGDLALASELQNRLWVDGPFREPGQVDSRVRRRAAEMNRAVLASGTWGAADANPLDPIQPPAAKRLPEIRVPTLIVAGALDNPEILRAADVMAAGILDAKKIVIPDCAHLPNMENPAGFNRAVLDFLGELEPGA
jgi:pimeloyl-ACP methyl ester carboxylesterase